MKIAIYYNLPFSGAKRSVYEQAKGLVSLGHEIDIYTLIKQKDIFDPSNFATNTYEYSYLPKAINIPFLRKLLRDLSDFYILRNLHKKIAQDIDRKGYDLVLAQSDHYTQAPFLLRYLQTKSVYVCLEPLKIAYEYGLRTPDNFPLINKIYENINRNIRKMIDRQNARAADLLLAISLFGRELVIQSFDVYPKIFYLGVDRKKFKPSNVQKKSQVLFVGQKLEMNGYKYALDAMSHLPNSLKLNLKVISINKDDTKRLSDSDMVKLYNESIVTLSLSNYDTFGLVPLESMACGTPVIAFNVAAYRETIANGKTGFLVEFDSKDIAEKISLLAMNESLRKEMGENGKELVKNWTWGKQINNLEDILTHFATDE